MSRSNHIRMALMTLVAMGVAAVPVIRGSNEGVQSMFNAPLEWIPRESPSRQEFNRFLDTFESVDVVLVSWDGCTVDDPRLQEVADALVAVQQQREADGEPELFSQVLTGYTMLRMLRDPPARLSRPAALRRLKGSFVGSDGETSCAVVALTETGGLRRRETLDLVLDAVERVTGHERDAVRLAGASVDGLATDDESIRSMQAYSLPAILISLLLCCLCLRSVWLTLPILAVGALGQALMLAMVHFLGITMNAILIVLPPLVFVLTVSAGVHLVNYYYDELRGGEAAGTITRAIRKGRVPCTLAAITTAVGLASLAVSEMRPVRQFGGLAAFGVLLTVLLLFLLLPGFMQTLSGWRGRVVRDRPLGDASPGPPRRDVWQVAAMGIWRHAAWITLGSFMLLVFCGVGLTWLRSSLNVVSLLSAKNRAVQDFHWFERHVGPLVPVEVVIHFDESCTLDSLQRMEFVWRAQREISDIEILDGALSAASFFPAIPRPGGLRGTARRAVLRRRLESNRDALVEARYLHEGGSRESWRISARILGLTDFDYGLFLDRLRERVAPVTEAYEASGIEGISTTYTGVTAVVYAVEKALLADLFDSFLTALACVTVIMMLALRSFRAGLLAMVPNIFPTLVLFGGMGWLGIPVDVGTVMTASVALGLAVDGTFHFLKWFRHEVDAGKPRRRAVAYAYRHCGRALTQATVICALGLLIFTFSGFLPARHFALNLMLLLFAALVGDLIVLPALLVGPLGRVFIIRRTPQAGTHVAPGDETLAKTV